MHDHVPRHGIPPGFGLELFDETSTPLERATTNTNDEDKTLLQRQRTYLSPFILLARILSQDGQLCKGRLEAHRNVCLDLGGSRQNE